MMDPLDKIERLQDRLSWLDEFGWRPDEADEARRIRAEIRKLEKEAFCDETLFRNRRVP